MAILTDLTIGTVSTPAAPAAATRRPVLTLDGKPLASKAWRKITLQGDMVKKYAILREAQQAFDKERANAIRGALKVALPHDVKLSYKYGPSFVVCDAIQASGSSKAIAIG